MTKQEIIKIFKNAGFNIFVDNRLGELVEMSAEDAFVFSSITGANYLINQNGVTMKGRTEVFIHRSVFSNGYLIYSPGLYSRDINGYLAEGNSADQLLNKYPSVFQGTKYVLIRDIPNNAFSNIEKMEYEAIKATHNPSDYILFKNYSSGTSFEPFLEYLLSLTFAKRGYLVENQVPWFQQNLKYNNKILQGGIPDFSASKTSFFEYINTFILGSKLGLSVNLLSVIKNFRTINNTLFDKLSLNTYEHELIICEAKCTKSGAKQGEKQMAKYAEVELADRIYLITPQKSGISHQCFGEFYIKNCELNSIEATNKLPTNSDQKFEDQKWLDDYIKLLLLGNLKFEKIIKFIANHRNKNKLELLNNYDSTHLLDAVTSNTNGEFIEYFIDSI